MAGIVFGCVVPHPPVIVPDVGRGQESTISATISAMEELTRLMKNKRPDTTMIVSPHGKYLPDAMGVLTSASSVGDMKQWGSREPQRYFKNDQGLVKLIMEEAQAANIPLKSIGRGTYSLDHGVMVPMHFLYDAMEDTHLVPLTFSWLPLEAHFAFGKALRRAAEKSNMRIALIASGDMAHRLIPQAPAGYDPMARIFDEKLVHAVSRMDSRALMNFDPDLVERAGECGLRSVVILMGALDGLNVKPKVLSYEGPFGVGYLVASMEVPEK
jgi:AmmeMemoRadiSam system protein B